jgi:MscS family membrane protein
MTSAFALRSCPRAGSAALGLVLLLSPVVTSNALAQSQDAPPPPATEQQEAPDFSKPMGPPDPFNRGTPRGSMYAYLKAARDGDYELAAEHLDLRQLPPEARERGAEFARRLKVVLDQKLWVELANLSDTNAGVSGDGLPAWQDRVGEIGTRDGKVDILMQRVPRDGDGVRIWKVAASTVSRTPFLYAEFEPIWLEERLPAVFFEAEILGVALWKWASLASIALLAWLGAILLAGTSTRIIAAAVTRTHLGIDSRIVALVRRPVRMAWTVVLFALGHRFLGLTIAFADTLRYIERILLVVAFAWALFRVIDLTALALRARAERQDNMGLLPVLIPGARFAKIVIILIGVLGVLGTMGVNISAAVAGLGVGGIAVALAAQRSLENLFGGVSLFADRPVRVGDFCRYEGEVGTVEEIGLRSTRIRTLDRTVVTIPNAEFSNLRLENYALRDRMRLLTTIGVRYETTPDQLRYLLAQLREILLAHPRVTAEPARVRFVSFGAFSLDIEVFAYVDAHERSDFLAVQEDLFLLFMQAVSDAGTGFAFPSTTTYVGRDEGLNETEAREAERRVAEWREKHELPFPEFSDHAHREVWNTLAWPPQGSPGSTEPTDS